MPIAAVTLFYLGLAIALLAPLPRLRHPDARVRGSARRALARAACVLLVWGGWKIGTTFAPHVLNVGAILLGMWAAAALTAFAFRAGPWQVAMPAGLACTAAWLLALVVLLLTALLDGGSPVTVSLGDGTVCRQTVYGMVAIDSGEDDEIDRRILFIDRRLFVYRHSDVEPDTTPPPGPPWQRAIERCQALAAAANGAAAEPKVSPGAPAPP